MLPAPLQKKPSRTGRGAAVLVSVAIVSAAALTALANMIEANASLSPDGQNAIEEVNQLNGSVAWKSHVGHDNFDGEIG